MLYEQLAYLYLAAVVPALRWYVVAREQKRLAQPPRAGAGVSGADGQLVCHQGFDAAH